MKNPAGPRLARDSGLPVVLRLLTLALSGSWGLVPDKAVEYLRGRMNQIGWNGY